MAQIKRISHPKQLSYAKENDKVIHINHDHSVSVEIESMNIGDISSEEAIIEALIDVNSREELNHVTQQLTEAMQNNWYVIFDVSYLCVSDTGAILFGCKASITQQTEQDLFLLK
ncbi:MAG: hypothetical protein WA981_02285 [Glaciecola sp.]